MEDCQVEANKLKEENNLTGALEYMVLSPHPESALEVGLSLIKGDLASSLSFGVQLHFATFILVIALCDL